MWKKVLLVVLLIIISTTIYKKYNIENFTEDKTSEEYKKCLRKMNLIDVNKTSEEYKQCLKILSEKDEKEYEELQKIKGTSSNYMREPTTSNSISTIPIPTIDYISAKTKVNLPQILKTKEIDNVFIPYIKKNSDNSNYVKINFYLKNQDSWKDKELDLDTDIYVNHKVIKSKYDIVNKILLKINNIIKRQFILYKYAIANIFLNKKNNHTKFGIIFILLENFGVYGYTIYVRGYEDLNTKQIIFDSYEIVGYEYTSKLFLEKPYLNLKKYNIPSAAQYGVKPEKIKTPSKYNVPESKKPKLYACFSTVTGGLIKSINKMICESGYDSYGNKKDIGVWDKPCEEDNECFFYKSNKNYSNKFGKCVSGYCQLPLNVKRIGYKYYDPNTKPLCYNCDKDDWFVASKLGLCCDKQKNQKNFKSPDYAFGDDLNTRMNYFRKKNFLVKSDEYDT